MSDKLNMPIGSKDATRLAPGKVVVKSVAIEEVRRKAQDGKPGEIVGEKVVLMCKHPDKEEEVKLSSVKYIKGDAVKETALWYNEDDEGKISKNSALAATLRFFDAATISGLVGKELNTILDETGYLCIKAY